MDQSFENFDVLLEKYFDYNIPESKKKQLIDFYVVQIAKGWTNVLSMSPEHNVRGNLPEGLAENLDEIEEKIAKHLKPQILKAAFFSIASETYHGMSQLFLSDSLDAPTPGGSGRSLGALIDRLHLAMKDDKDPTFRFLSHDKLKKFMSQYSKEKETFGIMKHEHRPSRKRTRKEKHLDRYQQTLKEPGMELAKQHEHRIPRLTDVLTAIKKSGISYRDFIEIAYFMFLENGWAESFGGKMWADIAKGWLDLYDTDNLNDTVFRIDRINQLQHNNGTVFDKVDTYAEYGNFEWLTWALDMKFTAKSVEDLLPYGSQQLASIAKRIEAAAKRAGIDVSITTKTERDANVRYPSLNLSHKDLKSLNKDGRSILADWPIVRSISLDYNQLYNLEGCPVAQSGVMVRHNKLVTLEGSPDCNYLDISDNLVTSLKGISPRVRNLEAGRNNITSFEHTPERCIHVSVTENPIKNFVGLPEKIGTLNVSRCPLESIEGLPKEIGNLIVYDKWIDINDLRAKGHIIFARSLAPEPTFDAVDYCYVQQGITENNAEQGTTIRSTSDEVQQQLFDKRLVSIWDSKNDAQNLTVAEAGRVVYDYIGKQLASRGQKWGKLAPGRGDWPMADSIINSLKYGIWHNLRINREGDYFKHADEYLQFTQILVLEETQERMKPWSTLSRRQMRFSFDDQDRPPKQRGGQQIPMPPRPPRFATSDTDPWGRWPEEGFKVMARFTVNPHIKKKDPNDPNPWYQIKDIDDFDIMEQI